MGRGGQHHRRIAVREARDVQPVLIDRNWYGLDTVVSQHHPMQPEPWILHRQRLIG